MVGLEGWEVDGREGASLGADGRPIGGDVGTVAGRRWSQWGRERNGVSCVVATERGGIGGVGGGWEGGCLPWC